MTDYHACPIDPFPSSWTRARVLARQGLHIIYMKRDKYSLRSISKRLGTKSGRMTVGTPSIVRVIRL